MPKAIPSSFGKSETNGSRKMTFQVMQSKQKLELVSWRVNAELGKGGT